MEAVDNALKHAKITFPLCEMEAKFARMIVVIDVCLSALEMLQNAP